MAVSTLGPNRCVPGQAEDSSRAPVTVNVLTPALNRVPRSKPPHIRCFWSRASAPVVPCSPMPVVASLSQMAAYQVCSHQASECLVAHVLDGTCANVMTLRSQRRRWLPRPGGNGKQGVRDKVSLPSSDTSAPTVRTPDWSRPVKFYLSWWCYRTRKCATYVCMCLTSLPNVAAITAPC